jgi:hypothetical protein
MPGRQVAWQCGIIAEGADQPVHRPPGWVVGEQVIGNAPEPPAQNLRLRQSRPPGQVGQQGAIGAVQVHLDRFANSVGTAGLGHMHSMHV